MLVLKKLAHELLEVGYSIQLDFYRKKSQKKYKKKETTTRGISKENKELKQLMDDMQNRGRLIFKKKESEVTAMVFNKDSTAAFLGFRNGQVILAT